MRALRCAFTSMGIAISVLVLMSYGGIARGQTRPSDALPDAGSTDSPTILAEDAVFSPSRVAALTDFASHNPKVQYHWTGSRISKIYGPAFSSGADPLASADTFRLNHSDMFGVRPNDLLPLSTLDDQRHTQPIMYSRQRDNYKFTLVYYSQYSNSVPVFRADLRLLVRNEPGHPLVLASANLRDLRGFSASANPTASENPQLGKAKAKEAVPSLINFSHPERVVWAGFDGSDAQPRMAVTFSADNRGSGAKSPEDWLFVADASTGEILYREPRILYENIEGHVGCLATEGMGADICEDEVLMTMRDARLNIGNTLAFTDEFGDFVIANDGEAEVTLESRIRGLWFVVYNAVDPESVLSLEVTPPGPADFMHNASNTSELNRAEVNAYVQANLIRDAIVAANPEYPEIGDRTRFPVHVNRTDGVCPGNAWYSPGNRSINFCQAGGSAPNTAWSSVVHHEYGHHLVAAGGSGQGQYGEGVGDVMSIIVLDDPRLAIGFFGNCTGFLRNADNTMQYPCSGGIHFCGQLISGCVWDTRNELVITEPDSYQQILMDLMVNSVLVHNGSSITPQITIDWLTLDDDDEDITNGTPHYDEIAAGFSAHNMAAPELQVLIFTYPTGLPENLVPDEAVLIQVNIAANAATPVPGTGTLSYRLAPAESFTTVAMSQIAPNEYEVSLPAVSCPRTIEYFFTAETVEGDPFNDPSQAPNTTYSAHATLGVPAVTLFEDDFEANQGWTVINTGGLTGGAWQRGVPAGSGDRGDPLADADSSGQCYLTENADGDSDVDDGSTTLTSPIMDASSGDAGVSYYRWYSNTQGISQDDTFAVQVSDDGGGSWVGLEIIGPAGPEVDGGWIHKTFRLADILAFELNDEFRIRFIASDTLGLSIVEAGVDGVELFNFDCDNLCVADVDDNGIVDAADLANLLAAWGPNPGHPADLDGNGTVDAADLAILIAGWGDCS